MFCAQNVRLFFLSSVFLVHSFVLLFSSFLIFFSSSFFLSSLLPFFLSFFLSPFSCQFFTFVDAKVLERPTYKAFVALLDNYSSAVGVREVVTPEELKENRKFLEMIMDTSCMQFAFQWLVGTGRTTATTREEFIKELDRLWFGLYRRKVDNDSSGFEHVFCGERRDKDGDGVYEVTGVSSRAASRRRS